MREPSLDDFKANTALVTKFNVDRLPGSEIKVHRFLINAMKPDHSWNHMYRGNPKDYDIAKDLEEGIEAIDRELNPLRVHQLKHIRRFLYQRYSFRRAGRINLRLRDGKLWLWKDIIILRAALVVPLGYVLIFGAGSTWNTLAAMAAKGMHLSLMVGPLLLYFLVYLNARNQAGPIKWLWAKSFCVAVGIALWAGFYCLMASLVFKRLDWCWNWEAAWGVSAAAAPLSVLANFFFGSEKSLTDPL